MSDGNNVTSISGAVFAAPAPQSKAVDMVYATKQSILMAIDLQIKEIVVPEWGNMRVRIRSLTGFERDMFEQSMMDQRGKSTKMNILNARAKLCALCIIDEQNNRIFEDEDVSLLGTKSAAALNRVYEVAAKLSGITDEDMEELAGSLKSNPNGASTSS